MDTPDESGWYAVIWRDGVKSYLIDFDQEGPARRTAVDLAVMEAEEVRVVGPVPCPELDAVLAETQARIWRGIQARMGMVSLEEVAGRE